MHAARAVKGQKQIINSSVKGSGAAERAEGAKGQNKTPGVLNLREGNPRKPRCARYGGQPRETVGKKKSCFWLR